MAEIQMVLTTREEAQQALAQLEQNLGIPNTRLLKWDNIQEFLNPNHQDYIDGLRCCFLKPTGGYARRGLLENMNQFNWVEREWDNHWFIRP